MSFSSKTIETLLSLVPSLHLGAYRHEKNWGKYFRFPGPLILIPILNKLFIKDEIPPFHQSVTVLASKDFHGYLLLEEHSGPLDSSAPLDKKHVGSTTNLPTAKLAVVIAFLSRLRLKIYLQETVRGGKMIRV